jgi:hypothetical protein
MAKPNEITVDLDKCSMTLAGRVMGVSARTVGKWVSYDGAPGSKKGNHRYVNLPEIINWRRAKDQEEVEKNYKRDKREELSEESTRGSREWIKAALIDEVENGRGQSRVHAARMLKDMAQEDAAMAGQSEYHEVAFIEIANDGDGGICRTGAVNVTCPHCHGSHEIDMGGEEKKKKGKEKS